MRYEGLFEVMEEFTACFQQYLTQETLRAVPLGERDRLVLEHVAERGPINFARLHELMGVMPGASPSRLSHAVKKLAEEGLLDKEKRDPADHRQPLLTVTEPGRELFDELKRVRAEVLKLVEDSLDLSKEQARDLEEIYRTGVENFKKATGK